MKKMTTDLYNQLISKDTWKKVLYFTRGKDPNDLKREIKKNDIVPIILSIIIYAGALVILMFLFKTIGGYLKK